MRLSLSSAAAPDAALVDLLAACARRGLAALELVEGHAHGIAPGLSPAQGEAVRDAAREANVGLCALYLEALDAGDLKPVARLATSLAAPAVVPVEQMPTDRLYRAADVFGEAGARLLLAHGSDPPAVNTLRNTLETRSNEDTIGLAWEVRPERDDPARVAEVLAAAGPRLRYVRLHGGGPEAARQTGQGVGALMARLALARYTGPLVLTPSTPRYYYAWRAWLGRAGGWGCGSKQSDPSLVTLEHVTHTANQ